MLRDWSVSLTTPLSDPLSPIFVELYTSGYILFTEGNSKRLIRELYPCVQSDRERVHLDPDVPGQDPTRVVCVSGIRTLNTKSNKYL